MFFALVSIAIPPVLKDLFLLLPFPPYATNSQVSLRLYPEPLPPLSLSQLWFISSFSGTIDAAWLTNSLPPSSKTPNLFLFCPLLLWVRLMAFISKLAFQEFLTVSLYVFHNVLKLTFLLFLFLPFLMLLLLFRGTHIPTPPKLSVFSGQFQTISCFMTSSPVVPVPLSLLEWSPSSFLFFLTFHLYLSYVTYVIMPWLYFFCCLSSIFYTVNSWRIKHSLIYFCIFIMLSTVNIDTQKYLMIKEINGENIMAFIFHEPSI